MDNITSLRGNSGDRQAKKPTDSPMQRRRLNLEREKPAPINWRRGMFRLWILASGAWVDGMAALFLDRVHRRRSIGGPILVAPIVLLGPPLALLLFGLATRWAFEGFEADEGS